MRHRLRRRQDATMPASNSPSHPPTSIRTIRKPNNPLLMSIWMTVASLLLLRISQHGVDAHPPPPQANDIFGTVNGCASALIEMDDNQDGMLKKGEYLDFVNLLADFLCVTPRPIMDLEIQTVFFSIACLCEEREGFDTECCFGNDAAIYTEGAADGVTRTQDQDSYLRAACLLTQAILGPQQCDLAPKTLSPEAVALRIASFASVPNDDGGLSQQSLIWIIIGAILLALLCCILFCCSCCKKQEKDEEEEEEIIVKEEVIVEEIQMVPIDEESPFIEPPIKEVEEVARSVPVPPPSPPVPEPAPAPQPPPPVPEPAPAPPPETLPFMGPGSPGWTPVPIPIVARSAPPPEESDEESAENIGRRSGATIDDDSDDENNRNFGGEGMLPQPPGSEGIRLRHIEVEKQEPGEYEYPERELIEHKDKPDDDSVQEFEPYVPDSGVNTPVRPKKAPVEYNPSWQKSEKPKKEPFDARKMRKQWGLGDGEVWGALAAYEETRKRTLDNKFEWIVQGALDVLARAHESGELTKPRPQRAVSPQHMRTSPTPPPRAPSSQGSRPGSRAGSSFY